MDTDKKKVKKAKEHLSERIDALEISLLMLLNSLSNVKKFELDGEEYNVVGKIPETTLHALESILVRRKNKENCANL